MNKVPENGLHEFSIKLNNASAINIMIGFAVEGTNTTFGIYNELTSWMFYMHNGAFSNAGKTSAFFAQSKIYAVINDIVSMYMYQYG